MTSILRPDIAGNSKLRRRPWVKRKKRGGPPQSIVLALLGGKNATFRGLAQRTGKGVPHLCRILRGRVKNPSAWTAQKIAHALGVNTDTFLATLKRYAFGRASNPLDQREICQKLPGGDSQ